ncbi:MAG: O-antigen ligase family protein [Candidatus Atribacteria bacterium]|nr:O-antigen ligase family protein [Candidatus Atribacteria bacterium]
MLPFLVYFTFRLFFSVYKNNEILEKHLIFFVIIAASIPLIIGTLEYAGIIPLYVTFEITGGFLNPGVFAIYLATLVPFIFSLVFIRITKNNTLRIISGIILFMLVAIIIITRSRSSWIAGFISILYVLLHHPGFRSIFRKFTNTVLKKAIIVSFLVLAVFSVSVVLYKYKKDSADGRLFIWGTCTEIIGEKPIFGHGYDSFTRIFTKQQRTYFEHNPLDIKNGILANDAKFAFNDYLQIMVDTGITGLGLFLCIIFFSFRSNYKIQLWQKSKLLIAAKASIIAILTSAMFSYPMQSVINYMILFVLISYISSMSANVSQLVKVKKHISIALSWVIVLTSATVLLYQVLFFRYSNKWKNAFIESQTFNAQNSISTYREIAPFFSTYFPFLFNFGSTLYNCGRFDESVEILESARKLNETCDLLINLGECYSKLEQYQKAESCFIDASNIIPHKLIPRYKLFKIYQNTSQPQKAYRQAIEINNMDIKIYTPLAGQIKNEVLKYIKSNEDSSK